MSTIAVLGSGIVGTAAAWDLTRRGHTVVVADTRAEAATTAGRIAGAAAVTLDATDDTAVRRLLDGKDAVVSAVPYALGMQVATAAVATATHYFDFGGNPTMVGRQLLLDESARSAGVAVVPDCGLAPGMADVLAVGAFDALGDGPIDEVRLRVGALPRCQRVRSGTSWPSTPPASSTNTRNRVRFSSMGSTRRSSPSSKPRSSNGHTGDRSRHLRRRAVRHRSPALEGRVQNLDYKTLRFPGHGVIFRAMLEVGLFDESPQPDSGIAPARCCWRHCDATCHREQPISCWCGCGQRRCATGRPAPWGTR